MVPKDRSKSRGVWENNWALWHHQMPQKFLNEIDFQANSERQFYRSDKCKCALETLHLRTECHFNTGYTKGPLRYHPEIPQKNPAKLFSNRIIKFEMLQKFMADTKNLCIFTGRENQICSSKTQSVSAKAWCSPVRAQGDVEQTEKHCSYYGCQQRSHPGAKLAEVTVLHNGDQNRATHKHGVLQQRERARVSFFVLTGALPHINASVN